MLRRELHAPSNFESGPRNSGFIHGVVVLEWYHPIPNPGQLKIREWDGHAPISQVTN
jgi:hypothetical protein